MSEFIYFIIGIVLFWLFFIFIRGFYVVNQNERAVKTVFGRAKRVGGTTAENETFAAILNDEQKQRYDFPNLKVIKPGGPYFKWPWEKVHKVSIATTASNMAYDPESRNANKGNTVLDAVTKDQLNVELSGQIRYRVSERNIYAFLFGVKNPIAHVMGYFVSILREKVANFEGDTQIVGEVDTPSEAIQAASISINDLRKNLRVLNDHMDNECLASEARYGIIMEASLITGIDPPDDVDSALAAINTAHNQVSSDISLAQAAADQKIVQAKRALEIETLKAEGETEGIKLLAKELEELKSRGGTEALNAYIKNARLALIDQTKSIYKMEEN